MMNIVPKLLYIDPGSGSMLVTVIIGIVSTLLFAFKNQFIKLKFRLSGGKGEKAATVQNEKMPYVIFSDSKRYWNVFKPICDEFEKRETECRYWTASPDDPALDEPYKYVKCEFIGEGNKAFARLNTMNAKICLSTTPGLDVLQWKRSKKADYYVHTYHSVDEGLGYRMFGCDFFDSVLLTGDFQERYIRILEEKRNLPAKEVRTVGCTYLDEMIKRKNELDSQKSEDRPFTVLLAPSWGDGSILNRFGEKILTALTNTGYKIIVRPHPQSYISDPDMLNSLKEKFPESDKFSWNSDNDNFKVLSESDIMITDFSGIIFDYTFIFDKPLIYADTSMDTAPYDAAWIDEPLWRLSILPELGKQLEESDFDNIKEIIDSVSDSDYYREGRRKYSETAWQCKGKAAEMTVDYLIEKYNELENLKNNQ